MGGSVAEIATHGGRTIHINGVIAPNNGTLHAPMASPAVAPIHLGAFARTLIICTSFFIPAASVRAQKADAAVDVCLVLAGDISASIADGTAHMQREGHAQALSHPDVVSAIAVTRTGRIAVTYVEWSSHRTAHTILPWRIIENARGAREAADVIRDMGNRPGQDRLGHTGLSWAISYASQSLAHCPATPDRTIIDISANGPNNDGPAPEAARDHALAMGHIINALAIPAPVLPLRDLAASLDPDEGAWQHPTDYLYSHVTGGPNSFATTARTIDDYFPVLRRKIVTEIAGLSHNRLEHVQDVKFAWRP
ncbi:MAG: DUF1194 domain-containing protein [Mesorhizobium sp.]|nr:MAG: DUF1194 domain-containing protein [Mesorhizobium sp.]TIL22827.1 MAG: DUF1194 domain-containing protein [Mesorhizobium sp.]